MAQMAQQNHLVIKAGYLGEEQSEEVKKQLRRAYLRGTLMDVVIDCETEGPFQHEIVKVIGCNVTYKDIEHKTLQDMQVYTIRFSERFAEIDCGKFQPDDYADDTPTDE